MTEVRITYFDTAMVLIEVNGLRLLTDPVLDPPGVVRNGPVELEKLHPPTVAPEALGRIDAVLLSHDQHADNLDQGGRALLSGVGRVLTTPDGAGRLGGSAKGLEPWESVTLTGPQGGRVTVTAVPAQHGPDGTDEATGPVTGFLVAVPQASARPIYLSGDTIRFAGTSEIARRYAPVGLAVLHLGRAKVGPLGDAALSLDASEASKLADELQAATVVPVHFEGWGHFSEDRTSAARTFAALGMAARVRWPERGRTLAVTLPGSTPEPA